MIVVDDQLMVRAGIAAVVDAEEDLAVVGYNDVELAEYLGLTTVRVPMREGD